MPATTWSQPNRECVGVAPMWSEDNVPDVPATGATAGTPGSWTPAGSVPPASPATIGAVVASPTTAWTVGQYVQTATAGTAGRAYWSGTAWTQGSAPGE